MSSNIAMTDQNEEALMICPAFDLSKIKVYSESADSYLSILGIDSITVSYEGSDGDDREKTIDFPNISFQESRKSASQSSSTEPSFTVEFNRESYNLYRFHPGVVKRVLAKNMPLDEAITAYYSKNSGEPRMYPNEFITNNKKFCKSIEKMCNSA